jgi:hypothetical protein
MTQDEMIQLIHAGAMRLMAAGASRAEAIKLSVSTLGDVTSEVEKLFQLAPSDEADIDLPF